MYCVKRWLLLAAFVLAPVSVNAADEMTDNPYYKHWAGHKPGTTMVLREVTKVEGPEKKFLPDGVEDKTITYKLLSVSADKVVLETVAAEVDFLGVVESAPAKTIYSAKVKKAFVEYVLEETGAKSTEVTVKVLGKDVKCALLEGVQKRGDGEELEFKVWISKELPGGIVKRIRTNKVNGKVVATTTTELKEVK